MSDQQEMESLANMFANDPLSVSLAKLIHALAPGEKLPSERTLAEQLDVSRTALRDRLATLEGLGVLSRRGGSGTYIDALQPSSIGLALSLGISASHLSLESLESVRIALERQAAREACRKSDPVLIAYMRRAVDTMGATDLHDEVMDADHAFHQSLLRAAGNPSLEFFADALSAVLSQDLADRSRRLKQARLETSRMELLVFHHEQIYAAILEGDERKAMDAVDAHFDALGPPRTMEARDLNGLPSKSAE